MDNADQIAQAVEAVVRLLLQQESTSGEQMDLDTDSGTANERAAQEARIKSAREYCLRILGRYDPQHGSCLCSTLYKMSLVKTCPLTIC